ncbi:uncharacterized protein AFUA_2G10780 [Aspergillus fumigatus Af293]|uniref:Uncharacterized protein n=2 Tax=Aspergillus fumigatus TaxID=746128 RepID=Q4X192_ASPFU|nr:hypothetical protein AFUA_2G10780 [Aspergillus fumigatus Af293]EAL93373.1 hypothetical protein AFUA_2G10780 [Aspergillus fumigatus Af293]EDP54597.1 hypothetical protein AFUB_026560 [Aspergillus fumigatus A1163]
MSPWSHKAEPTAQHTFFLGVVCMISSGAAQGVTLSNVLSSHPRFNIRNRRLRIDYAGSNVWTLQRGL